MIKILVCIILFLFAQCTFGEEDAASKKDLNIGEWRIKQKEGVYLWTGRWLNVNGIDTRIGRHVTTWLKPPVMRYVNNYNDSGLMNGIQRIYMMDNEGKFHLLGSYKMNNGTGVMLKYSSKSKNIFLPYKMVTMVNGKENGPAIEIDISPETGTTVRGVDWRKESKPDLDDIDKMVVFGKITPPPEDDLKPLDIDVMKDTQQDDTGADPTSDK